MSNNSEVLPKLQPTSNEEQNLALKVYVKPLLEDLGDLRALTLGPSPLNTPDSNFTGAFLN